MRAIIQRVSHANVAIEDRISGEIGAGLLVLLGVSREDTEQDIEYLVRKITRLRVFNDQAGKMNLSVQDIGGGILVVSQFTLFADTQKGNRPSFIRSAPPEIAIPLYENFLIALQQAFEGKVATGEFGAAMRVSLLNDGPVTISIDSKEPAY